MPAMKTYREAIFSGWFGPMGVGAVFLSVIAKEEMEEIYAGNPEPPVTIELIKPVVLFIVLASTLVHGTTIPLFKIGNRIRTRTLSIASTGSGQVLRLPKLQFGQQVNLRRHNTQEEQVEQTEAMSQLKRNTLMNTIQHRNQQDPDFASINMDDEDDGLNEEDFLPDESDETEVSAYDDSVGKSFSQQQSEQPTTPKQHQLPIPTSTTTESQSIRFLEPVNPRSGSAGAGGGNTNMEKNEASVSSFRSWMHRNKDSSNATEDLSGDTATNTPPPAQTTGSGGGGLRNLFRRHNHKESIDDTAPSSTPPQTPQSPPPPTVQITSPEHEIALEKPPAEYHHTLPHHQGQRGRQDYQTTIDILRNIFAGLHSPHPEGHEVDQEIIDLGPEKLNSRIEVWDEPHHVVIEDKSDAASQSVIDKSDPNWKYLVKDKIKELTENIHKEQQQQQQEASSNSDEKN